MKVVVSGYVGKKVTGIGRNLISLLSHTGKENSYVIYTNKDMAEAFENVGDNITVKTYGVSKDNSLGNLLWTTFIFPFVVLWECADVSLIPNFTLLLFKFRPTSVIIHDLIEYNVPDKFSPLRMFYRIKIADPLMAKRSDRIMTISRSSLDDLVCFLGADPQKVDIIHCGVDRSMFHRMDEAAARAILRSRGLPSDFFLYAGTVDHPGKNSYSVIKAFERLCTDGYEGSLILAGMPGSGYDFIVKTVAESPVADRIVLAGYVTEEELLALYSLCRAFCFVSLYEGFGMPPLEAMACGAEIIVSNTSSLPEAVGPCGQKVPPTDDIAIADAMRRILDGFRSDAGDVERHLEEFSYASLSKQFEKSLEQTVKGG